MRRIYWIFIILALALAGCGSAAEESAEVSSTTGLTEDYADALSIRSQLMVGTLKLEGTEQAVTADQAGELLPLWQAVRSLTRSGTGATEELDAVLDQIQTAMTTDQIAAIAAMQLTRADNQATAQALGLATGTGEGAGAGGGQGQGQSLSEDERATRQAERAESAGGNTSDALLNELVRILESK